MIGACPNMQPTAKSTHEGSLHEEKIGGTAIIFGGFAEGLAQEISLEDIRPGECAICMEVLEVEGGEVYIVPVCKHKFHNSCIREWKARSASCPFCRGTLPEELGVTMAVEVRESDVWQAPRQVSKLSNFLFCPLGAIWPIIILIWFLLYKIFLFFRYLLPWCLYVLPKRVFVIWSRTRNEEHGRSPAWLLLFFCFIYPLLVLLRVWVFTIQISVSVFYTGRFYLNVIICRRRWIDAYYCIIQRTILRQSVLLLGIPD